MATARTLPPSFGRGIPKKVPRVMMVVLLLALFLSFQVTVLYPYLRVSPRTRRRDDDGYDLEYDDSQQEANHGMIQYPHEKENHPTLEGWRVVTDCTIYDFTCPITKSFSAYPFTPFLKGQKSLDYSSFPSQPPQAPLDATRHDDAHDDDAHNDDDNKPYKGYIHPPKVSLHEKQSCLQSAQQSLSVQVKQMLQFLTPISIHHEEDGHPSTTNMVAFSITDETYADIMIHDIVQMNRHVVQFDKAYFLVAIDRTTLEKACEYGYPVVFYHIGSASTESSSGTVEGDGVVDNVKLMVQGSKIQMSKVLVDLNQDFLFYEMDVWFTKSPIETLRSQMTPDVDLLVSTHHNNPQAPNIGFFTVRATDATREYFDTCLKLLQQYPNAHDQQIMTSVADLNTQIRLGAVESTELKLGEDLFAPLVEVKHPIVRELLNPHVIPSHEWAIPTERTIAMHFLAGMPLLHPFGKMMMAKETGIWYGFQTVDKPYLIDYDDEQKNSWKEHDTEEEQAPLAGYYARTGKYRRYLLVDDDGTLGGHSMQQGSDYHYEDSLKWKIAILVTLAQLTNRILILPRVMVDRDVRFLWMHLDISSIEDLGVELRETNFPSNKKSWFRSDLPFSSVARVALYPNGKLFLQTSNTTELENNLSGEIHGWDIKDKGSLLYMDALFGLLSREDLNNVEALFVNPSELNELSHKFLPLQVEQTVALKQVMNTFLRELRWCDDRKIPLIESYLAPVHARSTNHCYQRGQSKSEATV